MENYFLQFNAVIDKVKDLEKKPTLLLHSCCGPCSSAVLEWLLPYFEITVFFYNPNMDTKEEYDKRLLTQQQIIRSLPGAENVKLIDGGYEHDVFLKEIAGFETDREGGNRCSCCFNLRLRKAAKAADGYDYFATTLTVSPHKNAPLINIIGQKQISNAKYLVSDFKKKEGYKRSIELSKKYGLYRQMYCGCEFSK